MPPKHKTRERPRKKAQASQAATISTDLPADFSYRARMQPAHPNGRVCDGIGAGLRAMVDGVDGNETCHLGYSPGAASIVPHKKPKIGDQTGAKAPTDKYTSMNRQALIQAARNPSLPPGPIGVSNVARRRNLRRRQRAADAHQRAIDTQKAIEMQNAADVLKTADVRKAIDAVVEKANAMLEARSKQDRAKPRVPREPNSQQIARWAKRVKDKKTILDKLQGKEQSAPKLPSPKKPPPLAAPSERQL